MKVIFISIDTLRFDHLGCYGHNYTKTPVSPFIDSLAEKGLVFSEETNNLTSKSYFLNFLGMINQIIGDYEGAIKVYENALEIDQTLQDFAGKSTGLNNIGSIYFL